MARQPLSSSIYQYVRSVCKSSGKTLGEIAAQARAFESEMNAWIDWLNLKEGREDE
jgi:hypothetical protein